MTAPYPGWGEGPMFASSTAERRKAQEAAERMQQPVPVRLSDADRHSLVAVIMQAAGPVLKQHVAEQIAAQQPPPSDTDEIARELGPVISDHVEACINPLRTELAATSVDNAALRSCIAVLNTRCDAAEATVATLRAEIAAKAFDRDEIVVLRERLAAIEAKGIPEYHGVWQADDVPYNRGAVCTFSGALWHCHRKSSLKARRRGLRMATLCQKRWRSS